MLPLIEFPRLVDHYAPHFSSVFSAEAFVQFKRYISGLIVSENKTVDGINRLFVHENRNQSSLNRLLTKSPFSLEELNRCRLAVMNSLPGTALKTEGVLSFDDTLLTHYGRYFEKIAILYDHVHNCWVWAHNLVTLHYSDDQTDYPVFFGLWQPADLEKIEQGLRAANIKLRESKFELKESNPAKWRQYLLGVWRRNIKKPGVAELYDSKLRMAEQQCQQWVEQFPDLKLPIAFDSWYTQPSFCRFLNDKGFAYVGALGESSEVVLQTGKETLGSFAKRLKAEHLAAIEARQKPVFQTTTISFKGTTETYYTYCRTHRLHNFGKVRLVISHRRADLSDSPVFLSSNRLRWQAKGMVRIYRHRWPVEVYHEEGKAEGLDQYQLRDFEAIERHIALVAVVYSLLRAAQQDIDLQQTLQRELELELDGSVPFWRRATQAQCLWNLAVFISVGLTQEQPLPEIMAPLLRAVCAR
jgi:hypothetical protein